MRTLIAGIVVLMSCGGPWADELNDMPDLACARASSDLEREQLGCSSPNLTKVRNRRGESPLDRSEDD